MYFLSIIVLCFLFLHTFGKPTHVVQDYDKNTKDNSYRDSEIEDSDDYLHNEHKSSLKQFAGNEPSTKYEILEENNPSENEEVDHARPDKQYIENNNENLLADAHLAYNGESSMGNDVKKTAAYNNGIMLFQGNENTQKLERGEYNQVQSVEPSQYPRHLKQYSTEHKVDKDAVDRDRRQVKNNYKNEPVVTNEVSTQKYDLDSDEDEEAAIRRHVKKLSKEELDELLQSLTDDKRTLLKNIIDNTHQETESINKREITKKDGVNEDNSLVGNEHSDASKVHGGSENLEVESSITPNFEKQETTKKLDSESMYSKSTEISNSSEKSNEKINVLDSNADRKLKPDNINNLESSQIDVKIIGNPDFEKDTTKKESKREVNSKSSVQSEFIIKDPAILGSYKKEDLYCSENEELSQLWNEEDSMYNDNKYKREVDPNDLESIKSLEESFPNVENSDNSKPGSDMAPLVRVKRNPNNIVEKRDANIQSNLKVPYFSSVLENNEEGNDEAGEFQDDGFFDRRANFAKSGEFAKQGTDISKDNNIKYFDDSQATHVGKNTLETDTVGLGSDTDAVLSGIEGVNDNMMYNSVARVRRTDVDGDNDQFMHETKGQLGSQHEGNEIIVENNDAARYQENDAFGSLPRNYKQDLGRFKRIRRLKSQNNDVDKM